MQIVFTEYKVIGDGRAVRAFLLCFDSACKRRHPSNCDLETASKKWEINSTLNSDFFFFFLTEFALVSAPELQ